MTGTQQNSKAAQQRGSGECGGWVDCWLLSKRPSPWVGQDSCLVHTAGPIACQLAFGVPFEAVQVAEVPLRHPWPVVMAPEQELLASKEAVPQNPRSTVRCRICRRPWSHLLQLPSSIAARQFPGYYHSQGRHQEQQHCRTTMRHVADCVVELKRITTKFISFLSSLCVCCARQYALSTQHQPGLTR